MIKCFTGGKNDFISNYLSVKQATDKQLIKKGISTVLLEDIVSEFLWSIEPPFQTIQSYTGSHAD